ANEPVVENCKAMSSEEEPKGNLVVGLPSKLFENDQTCVACQKGKQHRASYHLGKFDGKAVEGFFVGYSLNSKAFRVFNSRTRILEENLHIMFSETTPNVLGTKASYNADPKSSHDDGSKLSSDVGKKVDEDPRKDNECNDQEKEDNVKSTNNVNAASTNEVNDVGGKTSIELPFDLNMPALEDYSTFDFSRDDEDDDAVAEMNNLDTTIQVSPIPTTKIHKDHPLDQVIRDLQSATQTRKMSKNLKEHGKIEEEVYVCQPLGFEDLDFSDRVYKVEKALYGLHQAPKALVHEGRVTGRIPLDMYGERRLGRTVVRGGSECE
ncbi:putative ribonuclease H-like domain-containing protein, partial [Tanacetum coccineum]